MASPPPATAFDLLAHPVRRHLVVYLSDRKRRAITVDALATDLADRLSSDPETAHTAPRASHLEIELHHVHLPKLEGAGALEYDHGDGRIVVRDIDSIHRVLDAATRFDPAVERCD